MYAIRGDSCEFSDQTVKINHVEDKKGYFSSKLTAKLPVFDPELPVIYYFWLSLPMTNFSPMPLTCTEFAPLVL